ncbi:hypothetical protein SDC9_178890 [bioreactor metagenome]|uniref:DUF1980 domain-containing protein n=1 Tax=bioreactor metagenome TaxID=1076179 RepID=A0A645GYS9_9ZZZZ
MKKAFIMMLVCLVLLAGCGRQSPAIPETNDKEAQSAGIPETPDEPDEAPPVHNAPPASADSDVIEIKEKMFIAQTNDIYINAEDYLGKAIKYEGIFNSFYNDANNTTYYYVIRYGPGCCGFDANAGFEVVWSGDYPNNNDWVEVVGVLEEFEEDGNKYLRLDLSSLTVLDTRGEEYVYQ